jgi:signal peptidase I
MNYVGASMNPSLKGGDGLTIIPYENGKISIGDVIVFRHPDGSYYVAHRVVSVDSRTIKTKGDNNSQIDSWILQHRNVVGKVVSARRGKNSVPGHGGTWGRIIAPALWTKKQFDRTVSRVFHPAYRRLARSGLIRSRIPLPWKARVLSFSKPQGKEFQLVLRNRVIGRRRPNENQWQIQRPFRLFIDESSLPK